MLLYTCGIGFILPQTMLGAMQPFPERAGAANEVSSKTRKKKYRMPGY